MSDEPRWLDTQEQAAWLGFVKITRLLFARLDQELSARSGLSHSDYVVLVVLSAQSDRRMRMGMLAELTTESRSRLSHHIARLEQAGWVRREDDATDRRGSVAILTDKGFATLEKAAPGHVEDVRRHLFDHLSAAEVRTLAEITAKVNAALERKA
ncbi:MarR family winged helix-turn-helix transcriptional regulator [Fodinicola acaciae]|uniref:MarR family winged helix-turn-helix transcriptional regulator n=1 Tax=Fodinicola acaciae TaxID=2681555 RepID=UPI0013D3C3A6|nr:MarR family transcriptional regulator [Fodinicola acaciae]